jgi:rod shape-determining protein MreD
MYWINIGSAVPDLYIPLVIFYSLLLDIRQNTITNWLTGLSKDLLSDGGIGINPIFFIAIGFFVWATRGILYKGHLVTQTLITFIFSIIYNTLCALHTVIAFRSLEFTATVWMIFVCSLYTAMVVPILFWIIGKFQPSQMLFSIKDN